MRYVAPGSTLVLSKNPGCKELARANKGKNGAPFRYPESLLRLLATIRIFYGLSFRVPGCLTAEAIGGYNAPDYRQIHGRINGIKVSIRDHNYGARRQRHAEPGRRRDGAQPRRAKRVRQVQAG